ncbi:MAG: transposase [Thioploca sp.]|nr:transposase [Thioploca sp.]
MKNEVQDLYIDYLISSFGAVTATHLSEVLDGAISHDKVTRMLAQPAQTSKELWLRVKPLVRAIESDDGVLIIDDSITEKPSTDESPLICWHYDHSKDRTIKGINFISARYHSKEVSLPIGVHLVMKPDYQTDPKTGKRKRKAWFTKNHYCRSLLAQAVQNRWCFRYVLMDIWFASAENLMFIRHELNKHSIVPLKANRKVALNLEDKKQGQYVRVDTLSMEENQVREIWLEGVDFPLALVKQVFTNDDGSTGILYLISSDTNPSYKCLTTIYKKRWNVECYHQSLKQNAALEKSPTQTRTTQTNHFFASLYAYIKLESLKMATKRNHFALKNKLYIKAMQQALAELQKLQNLKECVT